MAQPPEQREFAKKVRPGLHARGLTAWVNPNPNPRLTCTPLLNANNHFIEPHRKQLQHNSNATTPFSNAIAYFSNANTHF